MQAFIDLLQMPESKIFTHVADELKRFGLTNGKTNGDDYLYYDNNSPIVLLAHIDTVTIKSCRVKVSGTVLTNGMNDPLGGDDRCGVYAMLKIVEHQHKHKLPQPTLLFTNHEESGGLGMKAFLKTQLFNSQGVRLLIALDRKGCNDWVDYISVPKEVKQYIESFGYIEGNGSYSDVMDLSRDTLIPGINLSVGYYAQHTTSERVHFDELELTIRRLQAILKRPIDQLYKIEPYVDRYDRWGYHDNYNYRPSTKSPYRWLDAGKTKAVSNVSRYLWCDYCGQLVQDETRWDESLGMCASCSRDLDDSPTKAMLEDDQMYDYVQEVISRNTTSYDRCLSCAEAWWECECGAMREAIEEGAEGFADEKDRASYYHELLDCLDEDTDLYIFVKARIGATTQSC